MPISGLVNTESRMLTRVVNEMKRPQSFLYNKFFTKRESVATEKIEINSLHGDLEAAPCVAKDGEALLYGGASQKFYDVEPPQIRLKRPFSAASLLASRYPNQSLWPTEGDIARAVRSKIRDDMQFMDYGIQNRIEVMCAQMLDLGIITYSVEGNGAFTITTPRPAGNSIASLDKPWDDADPEIPEIEEDFNLADRLLIDEVNLNCTDVVMGRTAARHFRKVLKAQGILDQLRIETGTLDLRAKYNNQGAKYLGEIFGMDCWEYGKQIGGAYLIRENAALFIAGSPQAEMACYFGAHREIDEKEGVIVAERYSKTWTTPDPSAKWVLLQSRPLPILRRPGAVVDMIVCSEA